MKKGLIVLFIICGILKSEISLAEDLPAVSNLLTLTDGEGIHYVTKEGKLCVIEQIDDTLESDSEKAEPKKMGTYFSDINSLVGGYRQSVNMPDGTYSDRFFIKNDGTLWEYTINGDDTTCRQVKGVSDCVEACCGGKHILILKSDGTVYAWGENSVGQIGDGTTENANSPKKVEGLSDIVDIAVGDCFSLAVDSEGNAYIWGYSYYNENQENNVPTKIEGIEDCVEIARGAAYVLARRGDGKVYQWIEKYWGFETPFDHTYYKTPSLIQGIDDCIQISAQPFYVNTGLMLEDYDKVWYHYKDIFSYSMDIQPVVFERLRNVRRVVSGVENYIIKKDGSINVMNFNEYSNFDGLTCLVDRDSEDLIKVDTIRFVKRSEFAKKMVEVFESRAKEIVTTNDDIFKDVDSDSEYKNAIEKCFRLRLMSGTDEEGNFSPNKVLRREQAAVIVERIVKLFGRGRLLQENTVLYDDDSAISSWAKESVYKTSSLFDIQDNQYKPQEYMTNNEVNEVIRKLKFLLA